MFFSSLGTENNPMVPNQENMEGDQSDQSHNHAQRTLQTETCEQEYCPDEAGLLTCQVCCGECSLLVRERC